MQKSFDRASRKYYHARLMSNEIVIDSISFAKKSESLQGKIAVSRLERIGESLASRSGELSYYLIGELDSQHRPNLVLSISGQVALTCQRCLVEFQHGLDLQSRLVLVASDAQLPDIDEEDPDVDVVVANRKLNVLELIEDEIILGLPLAPTHEFECIAIEFSEELEKDAQPFAKLGKPS
jgi:uncharacterized protein